MSKVDIKKVEHKPFFNPKFAVFIGVLAVSFSSLFVKLSDAPALIIATYRLIFTFIILAPYTLVARLQDFKAMNLKEFVMAGASGVFLAMHFVTWFTSLKYTSVASSVVLVTTQPIFVVIGSYVFFKEKITTKAMLGGALALGGSIFIGATDFQLGMMALLGDMLALVAAMLVSGYLLIGRRLRARISLSAYTFVTYGCSMITLVLTSSFAKLSFYPYPLKEWLLFLGLAVVCTILGHTVFNWALRYIQASVVAVSILGEPLGAIVLASVFLREMPTIRQIIGGLIILTGLYIFSKTSGKEDLITPDFT